MRPRELLAYPALAGFAMRRLVVPAAPPAGAFRILLLHGVSKAQADSFVRLLDSIAATSGFLTVAEAEARLLGAARADDTGRVPFLLSLDDGFLSNFDVVRPILNQRGLKALFFVCPGLIDLAPAEQADAVAQNLFGGSPLNAVEPLMGWDEITALAGDGHVIGAHSMTHARLSAIDGDRLEDEVRTSGERIVEVAGTTPRWFAWPFGDIASIDAAGLGVIARHFRFCRSGVRGMNSSATDPFAIRADHIDLAAATAWQRLTLQGGLDGRYRDARQRLDDMAREIAHSAAP